MTFTLGIIKSTRDLPLLTSLQVITQGGSGRRLIVHANAQIVSRCARLRAFTCITGQIRASATSLESPRLHQGRRMNHTVAEPLAVLVHLGVR